jgi:nicotinamidase-related amidase
MRRIEIQTKVKGPFIFDPATTALLMIDFQRAFVDTESNIAKRGYDMKPLAAVVPAAREVLALARIIGMRVFHTREGYNADFSDVNALKRAAGKVGLNGSLGRHLIRGEPNHAIIDEVEPLKDEIVIDKPGFDAFYNTYLEQELQGFTHLVICGLTTECCVASTIRGAVDRGFYVLTITDACAGITQELHETMLRWLSADTLQFGWVSDVFSLRRGIESFQQK